MSQPTTQNAESAAIRAGLITTCHEEVGDERCNMPAEFVLWGKLFPREALGPRCYDHAVERTHWTMPSRSDQWAVIDLRPLLRLLMPTQDGAA